MDKISDVDLVKKIQKQECEESLKELVQRHSPLCYDIYKKYSSAVSSRGYPLEDLYSEKDFLIYKSAKSFDPSRKTKFSTWLGNQVRYFCLNILNRNTRVVAVEAETLDYYVNSNQPDESKVADDADYVFSILDQLKDPRIKTIFTLRYFDGDQKKMPWVQVAKKLRISTQTAINLHNKGRTIIYRKITSKELSDKI